MVLIMKAMREAILDSSARIKGGKLKVVEVKGNRIQLGLESGSPNEALEVAAAIGL